MTGRHLGEHPMKNPLVFVFGSILAAFMLTIVPWLFLFMIGPDPYSFFLAGVASGMTYLLLVNSFLGWKLGEQE